MRLRKFLLSLLACSLGSCAAAPLKGIVCVHKPDIDGFYCHDSNTNQDSFLFYSQLPAGVYVEEALWFQMLDRCGKKQ